MEWFGRALKKRVDCWLKMKFSHSCRIKRGEKRVGQTSCNQLARAKHLGTIQVQYHNQLPTCGVQSPRIRTPHVRRSFGILLCISYLDLQVAAICFGKLQPSKHLWHPGARALAPIPSEKSECLRCIFSLLICGALLCWATLFTLCICVLQDR